MATTQLVVEIFLVGVLTVTGLLIGIDLFLIEHDVLASFRAPDGKEWSVPITLVFVAVSYLVGTIVNFVSYLPFRRRFRNSCLARVRAYLEVASSDDAALPGTATKDLDEENAYTCIDRMRNSVYQRGSDVLSKHLLFQWNLVRLSRSSLLPVLLIAVGFVGRYIQQNAWWNVVGAIVVGGIVFGGFLYYVLWRQELYVRDIIEAYKTVQYWWKLSSGHPDVQGLSGDCQECGPIRHAVQESSER